MVSLCTKYGGLNFKHKPYNTIFKTNQGFIFQNIFEDNILSLLCLKNNNHK